MRTSVYPFQSNAEVAANIVVCTRV